MNKLAFQRRRPHNVPLYVRHGSDRVRPELLICNLRRVRGERIFCPERNPSKTYKLYGNEYEAPPPLPETSSVC